MDDQEKHRYCTNKFIELANELKDEEISPALVSGALMTASGIYATYVAAGNQGALGDEAAWPVQSFLKHFYHEFEYMVRNKGRSIVDDPSEAAA